MKINILLIIMSLLVAFSAFADCDHFYTPQLSLGHFNKKIKIHTEEGIIDAEFSGTITERQFNEYGKEYVIREVENYQLIAGGKNLRYSRAAIDHMAQQMGYRGFDEVLLTQKENVLFSFKNVDVVDGKLVQVSSKDAVIIDPTLESITLYVVPVQ